MIKVRCKNYSNCPIDIDGYDKLHDCESLDALGCPLHQSGAGCGAEVVVKRSIFKLIIEWLQQQFNSPGARIAALGLLAVLMLGGLGYLINKYVFSGPTCEISEARQVMQDAKVVDLEDMGDNCIEAGMAEADADKIVTGTVLLRSALDRKSPKAAYLLGRLFDPLKRAELEERSQVPELLPAIDPREALRFYDTAGTMIEKATAAASALRSKYPELRLNAIGKGGAPLALPGHPALLQRVLTKPGAELFEQPGGSGAGTPLRPFSLFYVLETKPGWLKVGEQLAGRPDGWVAQSMVQDWNVMLVMRYTPRDGRQPALFFKDELAAKTVLTRPGSQEAIAQLLQSANGNSPDPRLAAVEDRTVDWSATPYLMPILKTSPIVTDAGRKVFIAQVAAINAAGQDAGRAATPAAAGACRGGATETAVHQIAFVIDTTASMGPYIEGVRKIADYWSQEVVKRGISDKVKFAVVGYRNDMSQEPQRSGLLYVSKPFLELSPTSDANAFAQKMREISPASVSTHSFDEDAVAGLNEAMRLNWGQGCGARMVFLITDAGSLKSDDPRASIRNTGLTTIAAQAKEKDISIFTVHVNTPEAAQANNIEKAARQYRTELADGRGISLYRPIAKGTAKAFDDYLADVSVLLDALKNESQGKLVDVKSTAIADLNQGVEPSVKALVLGKLFAVQQRFLGAAAGANAPAFNASWTSDRDLANPDVAAFDVSVYLNRRQLSQLAEKCQLLLANAQQARTESGQFFELLRMLAAATAQDPKRFINGSADLGALMPSFLSLLPYKSDVLALNAKDWRGMGATKQDAFIRRLKEKIDFYRRVEADQSRWIQLSGSDPNDQVALIPLREMP